MRLSQALWICVPPQTNRKSSVPAASPIAVSGAMRMPLLAATGWPSTVMIGHSYSALPDNWLAMRSGSMADEKASPEYPGTNRKPIRTERSLGSCSGNMVRLLHKHGEMPRQCIADEWDMRKQRFIREISYCI